MNFICKLSTVLELSLTCLYIDLSCHSVEHGWINTSTVLEWSLTCLQILSCYSLDHGRINIGKYSVWVAPYLSIDSLCIPPPSRRSVLAQRALELFKKKQNTDMVFEIILVRGEFFAHWSFVLFYIVHIYIRYELAVKTLFVICKLAVR